MGVSGSFSFCKYEGPNAIKAESALYAAVIGPKSRPILTSSGFMRDRQLVMLVS